MYQLSTHDEGLLLAICSTHLPSSTILNPNGPSLSSVPWRRSNVRHTNNELYVDIIEVITATIAPSGRPLLARVCGTVAMTSKISGVPDLLLTLSAPGGGYGKKLASVEFPVFHPCVRLSRWKERPGELSFVPPDGKFVLASYEVDLLPNHTFSTSLSKSTQLQLPVTVEVKKGLGEYGSEFEVRVLVNSVPSGQQNSTLSSPFPRAIGSRGGGSPAFGGSSNQPVVEDVIITIPLAPGIKTLMNTKTSRGEWHHEKGTVTWKVPMTGGNLNTATATFRTGIVLKTSMDEEWEDDNEDDDGTSNSGCDSGPGSAAGIPKMQNKKEDAEKARVHKRRARVEAMMPRSVLIHFSVKSWLASGVKVESLQVVHGKGLGDGVKPYKGVKYMTKAGKVEVRC